MSVERTRAIERSVDSLQQIYAVVISLAVAQAIQSLLKGSINGPDLRFEYLASGLPAFIAFSVTVVPFWHGMNRHLDRCYLAKTTPVAHGALLLDFVTFFLEASLLFAAGWSLRSGIYTFICLGLLLATDMAWAFVSHQIHFRGKKSHARRWSTINLVAMAAAFLAVELPFNSEPLVLMVIAILRSIMDYWLCWDFYFPIVGTQHASSSTVA